MASILADQTRFDLVKPWRLGRAAEGVRLLSVSRGNSTKGSNPLVSVAALYFYRFWSATALKDRGNEFWN